MLLHTLASRSLNLRRNITHQFCQAEEVIHLVCSNPSESPEMSRIASKTKGFHSQEFCKLQKPLANYRTAFARTGNAYRIGAGPCLMLHLNFRECTSLLKNASTPLPSTLQGLKNPAIAVFWPCYLSVWMRYWTTHLSYSDFFNRLAPSTHSGE